MRIDLVPRVWVNLHTLEEISIEDWPAERQVHAVAGIGNPDRFFNTLHELGFNLMEHKFEDHHIFQDTDVLFGDQLPVVMTEKDAVKCRLLNRELMHKDYWYLRVSVETESDLLPLVLAKLKKLDKDVVKVIPDVTV